MSLCLVTGGAGFIGSHIVRRVLEEGHQVRILDDLSTGHRANIAEVASDIEFFEGSITDPDACQRAAKGVDTIFHLAARASVPRSVKEPDKSNMANVTGTLNVLIAARDNGVRRVVYSASSSAYGDTPTLPKIETMKPMPKSPYAVSKLAAEQYCTVFSGVYGLETVSLRYFNVFGPRQDPSSAYAAVIPAFVTRMVQGQRPIVHGDGEQSRDFCYIENVVNANLLGMKAAKLGGEVVNIACGQRTTLNEIVQQINQALGLDVQPEYTEPRAGDVKHSLADVAAAKAVLGYEPKVFFPEGLQRSIMWYKEHPNWPKA